MLPYIDHIHVKVGPFQFLSELRFGVSPVRAQSECAKYLEMHVANMQHIYQMVSSTCYLSHIYSLQNISSLSQSGDVLKFIFKKKLLRPYEPLYNLLLL